MPAVIDSNGVVTPYGEHKLAAMPPDRAAAYLAELRASLAYSRELGAWFNQIPPGLAQERLTNSKEPQ